jgi:hypothetical protein
MLPDNSERLKQLARARPDETLKRADSALASVPGGEVVTVARLAATAGVSRSWLYGQPDLLEKIRQFNSSRGRTVRATGDTRASMESNLRRLRLAHDNIAELTRENRQLRSAVARLHGQLREAAIRS